MSPQRTRFRRWALVVGLLALALLAYGLFWPIPFVNSISANESAAVGHLRNVFLAQEKFRSQHGCFASDLSMLPVPRSNRDGTYYFNLEPKSGVENRCVLKYVVTASPTALQRTGIRYFSIEETGILHVEELRPVGPDSPVLQ